SVSTPVCRALRYTSFLLLSVLCLLPSSTSFFFHGYGAHRDLHSFPTRRSSDLGNSRTSGEEAKKEGGNIFDIRTPTAISILVKKDRKSTRLNSSHVSISYAVFCLKKKK